MVCKKLNYSRTFCKRPPKMQRYRRWSLRRIQELNHRGSSSEKWSGHIFFIEDNLLHAISKLGHV